MANFHTEKPYVVATVSGTSLSTHYTSLAALEACKRSRAKRVIYGRHQGYWKALVQSCNGTLITL